MAEPAIQSEKQEAAGQNRFPWAAVCEKLVEPAQKSEPKPEEKVQANPADTSHTVAIIERKLGV
jgi:hypothetical protein